MNRIRLYVIAALFIAGIAAYFGLAQETPKPQAAVKTTTQDNPPVTRPAVTESNLPKAVPYGIPVLMYHSVGEEKDNDAVISPERFREQMAFLKKNGYNPIALDELYSFLHEGKGVPLKPVVITFDDGYRDTYEIAYPILKQYGFKSVLFIPAGEIGQRLTLAELVEMKASGMEIAAHSLTHRDLSTLSRGEQLEEVTKSKEILDRVLRQDTRYFCYPYSGFDGHTVEFLKQKGFKLAVTTNPGWAKPGDNMMQIKRIWMGNGVDLSRFEERLTREHYSIL